MNAVTTNDRFDRLTNLDISTHHRDGEYYFFKSDFTAAFAYWVIKQSPYDTPDIAAALIAFDKYISEKVTEAVPEQFSFDDLNNIINEHALASIPEVLKLNEPKVSSGPGYENRHSIPHPDYDFIDLGALARNIFFMLLREQITQS